MTYTEGKTWQSASLPEQKSVWICCEGEERKGDVLEGNAKHSNLYRLYLLLETGERGVRTLQRGGVV